MQCIVLYCIVSHCLVLHYIVLFVLYVLYVLCVSHLYTHSTVYMCHRSMSHSLLRLHGCARQDLTSTPGTVSRQHGRDTTRLILQMTAEAE